MNKYEFLIRFSRTEDQKSTKFKQFICQLDDELDHTHLLKLLNLNQQQIHQFYKQDVKEVLNWIAQDNHYLIDYTNILYPPLLKQISSPPLLLYVSGNPDLLKTPQISMVGSRQFSEYGAQWGRYFAGELAINGLTITSGLALGIDAICHRGALDVSGKTIAVLGSGLCNISPRTNIRLANEILDNNGAIVSEFLPNESARAAYFPRRNRIISGLSLGTFIIEASQKSGSLITARYALEQNRDVFALPGEITNENSSGTHWLIQQGAYLVTKPTDILAHYSSSLSWIREQSINHKTDNLNIIHPEIFAVIHNQAIPIDIIADKTGLSVTEVAIKLLELELEGLVKTVNGGYIRNRLI